jgi:hypothetical protein
MAKDGAELETGAILARKVECDTFQSAESFLKAVAAKDGKQILSHRVHIVSTHCYLILRITDLISIPDNAVGVVTTMEGKPLEEGKIAGRIIDDGNKFQDVDKFLDSGGYKGLQEQVILAGSYFLNPWFVKMEMVKMTEIPIGHVGVVISYVGEDGKDLSGAEFKHW